MSVGADRRAAAVADMRAQKAAGTWDATRGDISIRVGSLPIPAGYRTLAEVCDRWVRKCLDRLDRPDDAAQVALAESATSYVLTTLVDGSLQAYAVSPQQVVSRIPSTLWLNLSEDPGAAENAMRTIGDDCITGEAFEPYYIGCTAVVDEESFAKFGSTGPDEKLTARDPDKPWRDFSSTSAWLSSDHATTFIDDILAAQGEQAPRPVDRARALHKYLNEHGAPIEFSSVESLRRPGRMKRKAE